MKKTKYKVTFHDTKYTEATPCILCADRYTEGDRLALFFIEEETGEPFLTLTCNLPEVPMLPETFVIKNWSENEPYIKEIMDMGIFDYTGHGIRTGFVIAPVWKLKPGVVL